MIAYRRDAPATASQPSESLIVILNFSESEREVWINFPLVGTWDEKIDGAQPSVVIAQNDQWSPVKVPANYGAVYLRR